MVWITGRDVMDNLNVSAAKLGQACFDGRITAYLPDLELPIYDLSKILRIPKFPPDGINPMDHIQAGETVRWDWEEIIGVAELRRELGRIKYVLGIIIPVMDKKKRLDASSLVAGLSEYWNDITDIYLHPYADVEFLNNKTYEELVAVSKVLVKTKKTLENQIREKTEAPLAARFNDAVARFLDQFGLHAWTESNDFIWKSIMPVYYRLVIDGSIVDYEELEGQLVYFDFVMFSRYAKTLNEGISRQEIVRSYKHGLSLFWFQAESIEAEFGAAGKKNDPRSTGAVETNGCDSLKAMSDKAKGSISADQRRCLRDALRRAADKHGLPLHGPNLVSDRSIRNWLNGSVKSPPPGFSAEIFSSQRSIEQWAESYVQDEIAKGISSLPRNIKRNTALNDNKFYPPDMTSSQKNDEIQRLLREQEKDDIGTARRSSRK